MSKNWQDNQTTFASQEPLYEQPVQISNPEQEPVEESGSKRTKLIVAVSVGLVVLLVAVVAVFVILRPEPQETIDIDSPRPETPRVEELSDLEKEFREIQRLLQEADPVDQEFGYPPVDANIYIDQPSRR